MKKVTLIAIICCLAGLFLMIIAACLFRGKTTLLWSGKGSAEYVKKTYECKNKIDDINIEMTSDSVKVVRGNVSNIKIEYVEVPDRYIYEIDESGSNLSIKYKTISNFSLFSITIGINDTSMTVTVPSDFDGKLNIKSSSGSIRTESLTLESLDLTNTSGSIKINDCDVKDDINAKNSSGSINIQKASGADITATNTSGGVRLENIKASGKVEAESSSGSVRFNDVKAEGDLSGKATSGSVRLEKVTCEELTLKANSGSIHLNDVKAEGSFEAKTSSGGIHFDALEVGKDISMSANSGSIRGTIIGSEDDYSIISKTGSGSSNLNDSRNGSKNMDVSTTSGSIKIYFD